MILFLSIADWARMGYMLARSLKSVGMDAEAVTCRPPAATDGPDTATLVKNPNELYAYVERADTIVIMHSNPRCLEMPFNIRNKRLIVFHGGSAYRENPELINDIFNPKVDISLVQTGGLLDLGAKNEKWLLPPIDTDQIQPVFEPYAKGVLLVGHFPNKPIVKGSEVINRVVNQSMNGTSQYLYSGYRVPWIENMNRMARCDVYISACKPFLNGKPYGGGIEITDLEAAALGKIVVTHFTQYKRYLEEFGDTELFVANNPTELKDQLEWIAGMEPEQIQQQKQATRRWVEENHSFKAVGERLKGMLNE